MEGALEPPWNRRMLWNRLGTAPGSTSGTATSTLNNSIYSMIATQVNARSHGVRVKPGDWQS